MIPKGARFDRQLFDDRDEFLEQTDFHVGTVIMLSNNDFQYRVPEVFVRTMQWQD